MALNLGLWRLPAVVPLRHIQLVLFSKSVESMAHTKPWQQSSSFSQKPSRCSHGAVGDILGNMVGCEDGMPVGARVVGPGVGGGVGRPVGGGVGLGVGLLQFFEIKLL